jgi:hypothetical protein
VRPLRTGSPLSITEDFSLFDPDTTISADKDLVPDAARTKVVELNNRANARQTADNLRTEVCVRLFINTRTLPYMKVNFEVTL